MDNAEIVMEFFVSDVEGVLTNLIENIIDKGGETDLQLFQSEQRRKKARNKNYYEKIVPQYTDDLFKEHFRMSRGTFDELVRIIERNIPGRSDYLADLPKKVIFTIWILSKQESFLAAGDRFGFAKSTAYKAFKEILSALVAMLSIYVKFPNRMESSKEALIFRRRSRGFPGVVGAIDGCHIPIKAPKFNPTDFYNRNKMHSIILQGTCDHKGRFIDVFIGMPGRMHDARVFRQSEIFAKLNCSTSPLLPSNLHLVGDSAYPLLQNVMTPYRDNGHLSTQQSNYNVKLSNCRSIVERAFGLLKGKFRRLKYLDISTPKVGNEIISAACVLHNFLINRNEIDFQEMDKDDSSDQELSEITNEDMNEEVSGISKRNSIAETLM